MKFRNVGSSSPRSRTFIRSLSRKRSSQSNRFTSRSSKTELSEILKRIHDIDKDSQRQTELKILFEKCHLAMIRRMMMNINFRLQDSNIFDKLDQDTVATVENAMANISEYLENNKREYEYWSPKFAYELYRQLLLKNFPNGIITHEIFVKMMQDIRGKHHREMNSFIECDVEVFNKHLKALPEPNISALIDLVFVVKQLFVQCECFEQKSMTFLVSQFYPLIHKTEQESIDDKIAVALMFKRLLKKSVKFSHRPFMKKSLVHFGTKFDLEGNFDEYMEQVESSFKLTDECFEPPESLEIFFALVKKICIEEFYKKDGAFRDLEFTDRAREMMQDIKIEKIGLRHLIECDIQLKDCCSLFLWSISIQLDSVFVFTENVTEKLQSLFSVEHEEELDVEAHEILEIVNDLPNNNKYCLAYIILLSYLLISENNTFKSGGILSVVNLFSPNMFCSYKDQQEITQANKMTEVIFIRFWKKYFDFFYIIE